MWGAQGGSLNSRGGYGGYSVGRYNINKTNNIYVEVGQFISSGYAASYNGGGYGQHPGGGATSITTQNRGELYNFENYKSEVLLVAGGGGGGDVGIGGYGGGIEGGDGIKKGSNEGSPGAGGKQDGPGESPHNGSFGKGADGSTTGDGEGTGGGGWYGGGTGEFEWSSAGGGSGHVGNVTNGQTIAGNQTFPKPGGGTETGHTGNGYCIITWHPSL